MYNMELYLFDTPSLAFEYQFVFEGVSERIKLV